MTTRPSLIRSIPFWVLLAGSLALTGVGAWLVADRVARIGEGVVSQTTEGVIDVYAGPSVAVAGGVMLGAGLIGILLVLAIATLSTLRPQAPVEVVEPIDWAAETDETIEEPVLEEAAAEEPAAEEAVIEEPVIEEAKAEAPVAQETIADSAAQAADARKTDADAPTR